MATDFTLMEAAAFAAQLAALTAQHRIDTAIQQIAQDSDKPLSVCSMEAHGYSIPVFVPAPREEQVYMPDADFEEVRGVLCRLLERDNIEVYRMKDNKGNIWYDLRK